MPLMTKILKPEKFNAETLAFLILTGAGFRSVPVMFTQMVVDGVQFALDQMRAEGIIGE